MQKLSATMAENVYITNNLCDVRFSRFQLVDWINKHCPGEHRISAVEDLGSGEIYCYLVQKLYPKMVNMKRVKRNPQLELERLNNLKLLQEVLTALKVDVTMPIVGMAKNHFKPNFEFCQWFIRFYEKNLRPRAVRSGTDPQMGAKRSYKDVDHFKRSISHLSGTRKRVMVRKLTKVTETTTHYEMMPRSTGRQMTMAGKNFYATVFQKLARPPTCRYRLESVKNYIVEEPLESDSSYSVDDIPSETIGMLEPPHPFSPEDVCPEPVQDETNDDTVSVRTFTLARDLPDTSGWLEKYSGEDLNGVSLAAFPILSLLIKLLELENIEEFNGLAVLALRHIPPLLALLKEELETHGKILTPSSSEISIRSNIENLVDNLKVLLRHKDEPLTKIINKLKSNLELTSHAQVALNLLLELLQLINHASGLKEDFEKPEEGKL